MGPVKFVTKERVFVAPIVTSRLVWDTRFVPQRRLFVPVFHCQPERLLHDVGAPRSKPLPTSVTFAFMPGLLARIGSAGRFGSPPRRNTRRSALVRSGFVRVWAEPARAP